MRETPENRTDRLAFQLERAVDLTPHGDTDAMDRGVPLADFECEHGRMHGDLTPVCGCWPMELDEFRPMSLIKKVARGSRNGYTRGSESKTEASVKERTTILVSGVPPAIKAKALRGDGSLNDQVVGVLAAYFDVPFEPNGRPSTGGNPDSDRMFLRMPERLANRIYREAVRLRTDKSTLILGILAEHYGVKHTSKSKRTAPFGGGRKRQVVQA